MSVVKFEKPTGKKPEAQPDPAFVEPEVTLKLTKVEEAKILYAGARLGVPVDFHYEVVKWPWQANTTAHDMGIIVTPDGEVKVRDDNLEMIQAQYRADKMVARLTWLAIFGLLTFGFIKYWGM